MLYAECIVCNMASPWTACWDQAGGEQNIAHCAPHTLHIVQCTVSVQHSMYCAQFHSVHFGHCTSHHTAFCRLHIVRCTICTLHAVHSAATTCRVRSVWSVVCLVHSVVCTVPAASIHKPRSIRAGPWFQLNTVNNFTCILVPHGRSENLVFQRGTTWDGTNCTCGPQQRTVNLFTSHKVAKCLCKDPLWDPNWLKNKSSQQWVFPKLLVLIQDTNQWEFWTMKTSQSPTQTNRTSLFITTKSKSKQGKNDILKVEGLVV